MDFLKKAKKTMNDAQSELDKGFKSFGFNTDSKPKDQSTTTASAAPSTVAYTPQTTPAASVAAPSVAPGGDDEDLSVPRSTREGAPTKVPLADRKKIRDDFESKKPELENEFSKILGGQWRIHVDTAGVYSYDKDPGTVNSNIGLFIWNYFDGALSNLQSFNRTHGKEFVATISDYAPRHLITLEPTTDPTVRYTGTDFHQGRWRLLFRSDQFGTNAGATADNLADVLSAASKTAGSAGGTSGQPAMSMNAKKDIRDEYEAKLAPVLARAQKVLAAPSLVFVPNFETNYAALAALDATLDREEREDRDKLREDWEKTLGRATLDYFAGFVSQLEWQKFKGDEMMQEGFAEAVSKLAVGFVVTTAVARTYNDCVIEDGVLLIRTKPTCWWSNSNNACEKLSDLL